MLVNKNKLTLLVCSSNRNKLNVFLKKNSFVLKKVSLLLIVDFDVSEMEIPSTGKVIVIKNTSLSHKRNTAFRILKSEYIAITDDDCFFDQNWLSQVLQMMSDKHECVFGDVMPFLEGRLDDTECLIHIKSKTSSMFTSKNFTDHFKQIGFTNNCLIKRSLLLSTGGIKNWLGPGTYLRTGEDVELILSILSRGKSIFHAHRMIVFHNSWVNQADLNNRISDYLLGGLVAYYYHLFQGHLFSSRYIITENKEIMKEILWSLQTIFSQHSDRRVNLLLVTKNVFLMVSTPIIASYFFVLSKFQIDG